VYSISPFGLDSIYLEVNHILNHQKIFDVKFRIEAPFT
jgi:hypothetical protein